MTLPAAILFGSIGTLAETSEMQREAFNRAFALAGLSWRWNRSLYQALLKTTGGANRIEAFALSRGQVVDARSIHVAKTAIYHQLLAEKPLDLRAGVTETILWARDNGIRLGLVSTTGRGNIERLLVARAPACTRDMFDIVTDGSQVNAPKPDPEAYHLALDKLRLDPGDAVAIEDSAASLSASVDAGIATVAFPGENVYGDDFALATAITPVLSPDVILDAVYGQARQTAFG